MVFAVIPSFVPSAWMRLAMCCHAATKSALSDPFEAGVHGIKPLNS